MSQKKRDSISDYSRGVDLIWQEMLDRAARAKTLQLEADVRALEEDPPEPILRGRLRSVGASDEEILYFRLVLRQQAIEKGKTPQEARVVADDTLKDYLDKGVLRDRSDFEP